jgi:thiamine biosynthesis lipoprotein ApbE
MLSVTIVAETGMEADALSTGFFVMGVTDGLLYANLHETAVLMMDQKGELVQTTALLKYR